VKLLVDSWGWLVLEDSRDPLHQQVSRIYTEAAAKAGNVFSTNFVLDETISLLFRRRPFREASRFVTGLLLSPFITIEQITQARFQKAFDLRLRLRDKPNVSFTDLTTMIVARELKVMDILTGDKHFRQVGLGFQNIP
jgi:uncharacterized protein